jgi:hypothetical protein
MNRTGLCNRCEWLFRANQVACHSISCEHCPALPMSSFEVLSLVFTGCDKFQEIQIIHQCLHLKILVGNDFVWESETCNSCTYQIFVTVTLSADFPLAETKEHTISGKTWKQAGISDNMYVSVSFLFNMCALLLCISCTNLYVYVTIVKFCK